MFYWYLIILLFFWLFDVKCSNLKRRLCFVGSSNLNISLRNSIFANTRKKRGSLMYEHIGDEKPQHNNNINEGIVSLFPGQGSQQKGMGTETLKKHPHLQEYYKAASEILGYDCWKKINDGDDLDKTDIAQPCIFVNSIVAIKAFLLEKPDAEDLLYGIGRRAPSTISLHEPINEPTISPKGTETPVRVAMGLSLGEYSALCMSGALSFLDGVKVTHFRGIAMQKAADLRQGGMASVIGLNEEEVKSLIQAVNSHFKNDANYESNSPSSPSIQLSNFLCNGNYVISGDIAAVNRVLDVAKRDFKARMAVKLAVSGSFHSKHMEPALAQLRQILQDITVLSPVIPVLSNVDASEHHKPERIRESLLQQLIKPVQWELSMKVAIQKGVQRAFVFGPGNVLQGLMKILAPHVPVTSVH